MEIKFLIDHKDVDWVEYIHTFNSDILPLVGDYVKIKSMEYFIKKKIWNVDDNCVEYFLEPV